MDLIVKGPTLCVFYQRFNKNIFHFSNWFCVSYVFILVADEKIRIDFKREQEWVWPVQSMCVSVCVWESERVFTARAGGVNHTLLQPSQMWVSLCDFLSHTQPSPAKRKPDSSELMLRTDDTVMDWSTVTLPRYDSATEVKRSELEWTGIRK